MQNLDWVRSADNTPHTTLKYIHIHTHVSMYTHTHTHITHAYTPRTPSNYENEFF